MKTFTSNRAITAALFFALGGASSWGATKYLEKKKAAASANSHEEQAFEQDHMQKYFDEALSADSGLKEDGQFLSYEMDLEGQTPKEVKVQVQDGQVFITGKTETKEEAEGSQSFFSSSFHQSFPVPPNVDGEKYKVEKEDGKIVVKFPKKKA